MSSHTCLAAPFGGLRPLAMGSLRLLVWAASPLVLGRRFTVTPIHQPVATPEIEACSTAALWPRLQRTSGRRPPITSVTSRPWPEPKCFFVDYYIVPKLWLAMKLRKRNKVLEKVLLAGLGLGGAAGRPGV